MTLSVQHDADFSGSDYLLHTNGKKSYLTLTGTVPDARDWFIRHPLALREYEEYTRHQDRVFYLRVTQVIGATTALLTLFGSALSGIGGHGSSRSPSDAALWTMGIGAGFAILPFPVIWYEENRAHRHLLGAVNALNGLPERLIYGHVQGNDRHTYFSWSYRF